MRAERFLAHRYITGHRKQAIGIFLCVTLYITALTTSFFYRDCSYATANEQNWKKYGQESGTIYHADQKQVQEQSEKIKSSGSGVAYSVYRIATNEKNIPVYMGYMDPNAIYLKAITLQQGRFPAAKGEVAIEAATCSGLGLKAVPGQKISLPVIHGNKTQVQEFTLVGVLKDYLAHWKMSDYTKTTVKYPPPAILAVRDSSPPLYLNVLCGRISFANNLGGVYAKNSYSIENNKQDLPAKKALANLAAFPMAVFFILVTIFSVYGIVRSTLGERLRFLSMLRCIGMSKRKGKRLLLLQAGELFLASTAAGLLLSILICLAIVGGYRISGTSAVFSLRPLSVGLACATAAIAVFLTAFLSFHNFFKNGPLETGLSKTKRKTQRPFYAQTLSALWERAHKSAYRAQNTVSVLFVILCTFLPVFGGFLGAFLPEMNHSDATLNNFPKNTDYEMFVNNGSSGGENFSVSFPRNQGVSEEGLQILRQCTGLKVNDAFIDCMTSQFLLLKPDDTNPYLSYLKQQSRILSDAPKADVDKAIRLAGGKSDSRLLGVPVRGLDYESVRYRFPSFSGGTADKERFDSGEEVFGPDNLCKVGDTFTLVTPVIADYDTLTNRPGPVKFHVGKIRVAATYKPTKGQDYLVLSAKSILRVDPSSRYEYISLQNTRKDDPQTTQEIQQTLDRIMGSSENVNMRNIIDEKEQLISSIRAGQTRSLVSGAVFIVIILLTFGLSTFVKTRADMHSYLMMRAIGAQTGTIRHLLLYSARKQLIIGCVIGTALSYLPSVFISKKFDYLPANRLLLVNMPLTAAAIFVLLFFLSKQAIRLATKPLFQQSVSEELSATEL